MKDIAEKFSDDVKKVVGEELAPILSEFKGGVLVALRTELDKMAEACDNADPMLVRSYLDWYGMQLTLKGDSLQGFINKKLREKGYDPVEVAFAAESGEEWVKENDGS